VDGSVGEGCGWKEVVREAMFLNQPCEMMVGEAEGRRSASRRQGGYDLLKMEGG
jgi:hypothetical protein